MARLLDSESPMLIRNYEEKIEALERSQITAREKLADPGKPQRGFGELFELACAFLASPWSLWESGEFHFRRIVLELAFTERITYHREDGFLNPKESFPFRVLEGNLMQNSQMVRTAGLEPARPKASRF